MRAAVRSAFPAAVERYEGRTTWLYLDTKGLVTTGVGNLVDPVSLAVGLPWKTPGGDLATEDQVCAEWSDVKRAVSLANAGAHAASLVTKLRLDDDAVDELVAKKAGEFWDVLAGHFADLEDWPADAQLGLLLMAWALGPHFPARWPHFSAACKARDWAGAAAQCEISGARPTRNKAHALCFHNAGVVADPEVLVYPADALTEVLC